MRGALNGSSVLPRNGIAHDGDCECPTCGSVISAEAYGAILGRQRAHDTEIVRAAEARMTAQNKAEVAEAVRVATAALAPKLAKVEQEKKAAAAQIKALKESTAATIAARLEAQRETYEKATAGAVLAERAKYLGEKLKMEEQLQDMQRRLQAKTAHQLGEPAEVDLHAALETAFSDDRVSRVVKGVNGPDVIVEVVHCGVVVGKIVLDSKNHARWSNKFTSKLRSDQLAENADFAILSSSVFPAGAEQVHLQDNVIVASPQRVVVLVHLLRRQIVQNHVLKLSAADRNEKADKLYAFVMSPACTDLLDRIVTLTTDMADLDAKETRAHESVWKKRCELIHAVVDIHGEFSGAVSAIIAGDAP